jgi:hypothetical protein
MRTLFFRGHRMGLPDNVGLLFRFSSMEQIHLHIAGSISCLPAACIIVSNEDLSKAPSLSSNAPRAKSLYWIAFSMRVTTFSSAVSVDLPTW